jgi:hypothetical protein
MIIPVNYSVQFDTGYNEVFGSLMVMAESQSDKPNKDQSDDQPNKDQSDDQKKNNLVITPGGPRPREQVHPVGPGEVLRRNPDGTYTVVPDSAHHDNQVSPKK